MFSPADIQAILTDTCNVDTPESRDAVQGILAQLSEVLTEKMVRELPAAYILNLAVLKETKGIEPELLIVAAISYALDASRSHRRQLAHLLGMNHFILDQNTPPTTH